VGIVHIIGVDLSTPEPQLQVGEPLLAAAGAIGENGGGTTPFVEDRTRKTPLTLED